MSQNQQEQSEAKLLAFIEGELDAASRAEIDKHLEAHPQHRRLLEEMRGMRDWVRWLPKETAPAELAESFQMRLERTMLLDHVDEDAGRPPMRINRWPQLRAAAAVAALAVGLGAVVYFALPPRHSQFTTLPATRPSDKIFALDSTPKTDALKLADATDHEKQAQTRELDGLDKLADVPRGDLKRAATPATGPAEAETVLAKGLSGDDRRKPAAHGADQEEVAALGGAAPATQPVLAEAGKKTAEPTEQLARIAVSTYSLVNQDPALIELLRNSKSRNASLDARAADTPGSFGAAAPGAAGAEKAADPGPSAGSTSSPQAVSSKASSEQARQAGRPFVMVVLAADTDRAHKQIGDYLAANGIETQPVNDGYNRRVLDETITTKLQENAGPAAPHAAPVAAPAPVAASVRPEAPTPPRAAAPVAAPAASPARRNMANAAPQQQPAGQPPRLPAAPPATPPASFPAPVLTAAPPADQRLAAKGALANGVGPGSAPDANGDIFIARRMTARQARELQATLRQPAALQWAAVYCEPAGGSNPPQQLGDVQVPRPPAVSPPAVNPSTPPAVNLPAVSLSNPSAPTSRPELERAVGTQSPQRTDAAQAKDQVTFRYPAAGEAPTARKSAGQAVDKDNANIAARSPAPEEEARARGAATTRQTERALAASPTTPPPPAAAPMPAVAGGGAGGGKDQFDRANLRNKRDVPATAPSSLEATQSEASLFLEQAAGGARDEQPVDVVIVLQQSAGTTTTQPAR